MNIYLNRRHKLAELMSVNSAALFLAASEQRRNHDVEYRFRQNSNFWYLTGFNEPEAALLIIKTKQEDFKSFLFVRPREKNKEIWTGKRAGPEAAKEQTQVCEALEINELESFLSKNLNKLKNSNNLEEFYFDFANPFAKPLLRILQSCRLNKLQNSQALMSKLRLFKDDFEIEQMQASAQIAVEAHKIALKNAKEGVFEYFIEAKIEGYFREQGVDWAYPSIVASGENATILHYVHNNAILKRGDLLLIDAGCEKNYYASDITRTFPVQSKFKTAQKQAYELVLKAQKAAIEKTKIKNILLADIHQEVIQILSQGLLELNLLEGSLEEILEKQTYRKFYMHRTSHWLGLDVHDLGEDSPLQPNMTLTIEPGLYFDPSDETIHKDFRGIGIRIEDNILITEQGSENLTAAMPKEIAELEEFNQ